MKVLFPDPRFASATQPLPEDKAEFALVVIYQNLLALDWAMRLYRHLRQAFGSDLAFHCSWCNLEELGESEKFQASVSAAAPADMIIFALANAKETTSRIQHWIQQWQTLRESQVSALVALLGCPPGEEPELTGVQEYLQGVARSADMDYFSKVFMLAEEASSWGSEKPTVADGLFWLPEDSFENRNVAHWGINE